MKILGFETTCDETGIALIEFKNKNYFRIIDHKLRSQFEVHKKYGGIVPILAAREHDKNLPILFDEIYKKHLNKKDFNYLALSVGPGLPPSLISGKNFVINLAQKLNKKIIPINHLIAHFYSVLIEKNKSSIWQKIKNIKFPALGLLVSGGHTILVYFESLKNIKKLGETLDDALGESLDKSARILGLSYPGGPALEKLAKKGKPIFSMPKPLISSSNYNFSFSGIKTYFWQLVEEIKKYKKLDEETKANLAASYQKTVFETVLIKTRKAYEKFRVKSIIVTGGVAANSYLRKIFRNCFGKNKIYFPEKTLATDNGINIAFTSYFFIDKAIDYEKLEVFANLKI